MHQDVTANGDNGADIKWRILGSAIASSVPRLSEPCSSRLAVTFGKNGSCSKNYYVTLVIPKTTYLDERKLTLQRLPTIHPFQESAASPLSRLGKCLEKIGPKRRARWSGLQSSGVSAYSGP